MTYDEMRMMSADIAGENVSVDKRRAEFDNAYAHGRDDERADILAMLRREEELTMKEAIEAFSEGNYILSNQYQAMATVLSAVSKAIASRGNSFIKN